MGTISLENLDHLFSQRVEFIISEQILVILGENLL